MHAITSTDTNSTVTIVEYEPSYAAALADMWNQSNESWGGGNSERTAEQITQEMANSTNLHNFLAVDGDQVVGFCSFSHYRNDEGALYVPLLNVRPDYHSKKVGKMLILRAVATTVEMGWPRLDLFTWAGNTKAVPMYKKCGFFWEKKDDGVHLMNFIPTVLQTEALKPYMEQIDWYADSTRVIEVKPDGNEREGKFDCFLYSWEREGQNVSVEFEKTGRGIRAIDTPEYRIETEMDEHDVVFGQAYPVRYHIYSKTGKPVECSIKGRDDKNIRFTLNRELTVTDHTVVEGEFFVEPVEEEQSTWKTHPVVMSEWIIGGRKAEFRTGIAPKFPAKLAISAHNSPEYLGVEETFYLNVENHFKEAAIIRFTLPESDMLTLANRELVIPVAAQGKTSVPVSYTLKEYGVYAVQVEATAELASGGSVSFKQQISFLSHGATGRFHGEDHEKWYINQGPTTLVLNKRTNDLYIRREHNGDGAWWTYPRLGKPYSAEFAKKKAEGVRLYADGDHQVMEAQYESEDFPGLAFRWVMRLPASGLLEQYYLIDNRSDEVTPADFMLMEAFRYNPNRMILPYDGKYLDLEEQHAGDWDNWETSRISENWLFNRGTKLTQGITWAPGLRLANVDWFLGIEHPAGGLQPGETLQTESTYLALGVFAEWWEMRAYALKRREREVPLPTNHLQLAVNQGNPIVKDAYTIEITDWKNPPLGGRVTLAANGKELASIQADSTHHQVKQQAEAGQPGELIQVSMCLTSSEVEEKRSTLAIPMAAEPVRQLTHEGPCGTVYALDNGVLSLEAAPGFGNVAYSLKYRGNEWLDTSFPTPGPRSWVNPWHGGMGLSFGNMSGLSISEEKHRAEFATVTDTLGNAWNGVRLITPIEKHEGNRGMTIEQYFLMLPGAPVLCKINRAINQTGFGYTGFEITDRNYFYPEEAKKTGWMENAENGRYPMATNEIEIPMNGFLRYGNEVNPQLLHIVHAEPSTYSWSYTNNRMTNQGLMQWLHLPGGEATWGKPVFYLFGEQTLSKKELASLLAIRF